MVGGIRAGGGLREGGGNCIKYLKGGWNRKEGRGTKIFKKGRGWGGGGSKLGLGVDALKKVGLEPPHELCQTPVCLGISHQCYPNYFVIPPKFLMNCFMSLRLNYVILDN